MGGALYQSGVPSSRELLLCWADEDEDMSKVNKELPRTLIYPVSFLT